MFDGLDANHAEFDAAARSLLAHNWVFAKTMPENPHEYTLRRAWDSEEFDRAVLAIRAHGYRAKFKGRSYTQLDVNDHYYWTMGAPLPATILINRKRRLPATHPAPYDVAAPRYDAVFATPQARQEEEALFARLGDLSAMSVLDVGCGTGLVLDRATPARYLGIDPSAAMLERLHAKHPVSNAVRTLYAPLRALYATDRYDLVTALFGAASYLCDAELARIPALLAPGGRAVLMFYAPDYTPVTHQALGVSPPVVRHAPPGFATTRFGHYDLVEYRTA